MKFQKIGVISAITAAAAFLGCSSEPSNPGQSGERDASIAFKLTTDGVTIMKVHYDLNTQANADVVDGDINVPKPNSTVSLGVGSLSSGDYVLAFSATGTNGEQCISTPKSFHLDAGETENFGGSPFVLTCTKTVTTPDNTGSVLADVNVVVDTVTVATNVSEAFTYGPRSVPGELVGGVCTFPEIDLKVAGTHTGITYGWTASPAGGTFALNATSTEGTYTCGPAGGTITLTLTATQGTTTSHKDVTVSCDAGPCGPAVCGNGIVQAGEECDDTSARCVGCLIDPVCGDGILDGPAGDCSGTVTSAACDEQCEGETATCHLCQTQAVLACYDTWHACIVTTDYVDSEAVCDGDPACIAVQQCVLNSGCDAVDGGQCFCGKDVTTDTCIGSGFTPTGPCKDVIKTGLPGLTSNLDILTGLFDPGAGPTGIAMVVLDGKKAECTTACSTPTIPF